MRDKIYKNDRCAAALKLTIITVVKDDPEGLRSTISSIEKNLSKDDSFEYVVWVNSRSIDVPGHISVAIKSANVLIVGEDEGIFDSMNRAAMYAGGQYMLYLNARDKIIEPFPVNSIASPCLIPVQYIDYFGRKRNVKVSKFLQMGIPFCHQGMILPREGYIYDASYRYGADYLALLNFNLSWPLPLLEKGLIEYDTTGVSTVNRWEADKWTSRVIRNKFGILWCYAYLVYCVSKLSIKCLFDLKRKILSS